jgi:hypothetical protein
VITVGTVVEGDGEVRAIGPLIRRVGAEHGHFAVNIPPPFKLSRSKFTDPAELGRAVELQSRRITGPGGVLILLDADDDCALELSEQIRASYVGGRSFGLVVAVREYESVLLATHGMDPADAEAKRDAKGELRRLVGPYRETVHQAKMSAMLDVSLARGCRWFQKFEKELLAILHG